MGNGLWFGFKSEMVGVTGIEPVTPSMSTKCFMYTIYDYFIDFIILI